MEREIYCFVKVFACKMKALDRVTTDNCKGLRDIIVYSHLIRLLVVKALKTVCQLSYKIVMRQKWSKVKSDFQEKASLYNGKLHTEIIWPF